MRGRNEDENGNLRQDEEFEAMKDMRSSTEQFLPVSSAAPEAVLPNASCTWDECVPRYLFSVFKIAVENYGI